MSIKIDSNIDKIAFKTKEFNSLTPKAIRTAFYETGKEMVSDAKKYMQEPKHGRVYLTRIGRSKFRKAGTTSTVFKDAKKHVSSAAGEAPALWTGKLEKSIDFSVIGTCQMDFGVNKTRWGCDYAKYLEYKDLINRTGRVSSKIAPRPFISRAYNENRVKMISRFRHAIQQALGAK